MYVCEYLLMYTYACLYILIYLHLFQYMYLCIYIFIHVYMYVCSCTYLYIYVYTHTYEGAENMEDAHLVYLAQPLTKHCERALNDCGIKNI